jgi:phosphoribosylformylglycinamidine synthase
MKTVILNRRSNQPGEFSFIPVRVHQRGSQESYLSPSNHFPARRARLTNASTIMFKAEITVTLRPSILDPQGKAANHALGELGFDSVRQVRIGKFVEMEIEAEDATAAERIARDAGDKLLANPVMEDFHVVIHELTSA